MSTREILIVEDDAWLGRVLCQALERNGYPARLAGSVAEGRQSAGQRLALRRVERYGLDLVFFFSF